MTDFSTYFDESPGITTVGNALDILWDHAKVNFSNLENRVTLLLGKGDVWDAFRRECLSEILGEHTTLICSMDAHLSIQNAIKNNDIVLVCFCSSELCSKKELERLNRMCIAYNTDLFICGTYPISGKSSDILTDILMKTILSEMDGGVQGLYMGKNATCWYVKRSNDPNVHCQLLWKSGELEKLVSKP